MPPLLEPDAGDHHRANRAVQHQVRQHRRTISAIFKQREIDQRRLFFTHSAAHKKGHRHNSACQHRQRQAAGPSPVVTFGDKQIEQHQRRHEAQQAAEIHFMLHRGGAATLRGAANQPKCCKRRRDGKDKDPAPTQASSDRATHKRAQAAAAPRTDHPEADRPLSRAPFIPRFNQRQCRRHDAGSRQSLNYPPGQEQQRPLRYHQQRATDHA